MPSDQGDNIELTDKAKGKAKEAAKHAKEQDEAGAKDRAKAAAEAHEELTDEQKAARGIKPATAPDGTVPQPDAALRSKLEAAVAAARADAPGPRKMSEFPHPSKREAAGSPPPDGDTSPVGSVPQRRLATATPAPTVGATLQDVDAGAKDLCEAVRTGSFVGLGRAMTKLCATVFVAGGDAGGLVTPEYADSLADKLRAARHEGRMVAERVNYQVLTGEAKPEAAFTAASPALIDAAVAFVIQLAAGLRERFRRSDA